MSVALVQVVGMLTMAHAYCGYTSYGDLVQVVVEPTEEELVLTLTLPLTLLPLTLTWCRW